MDSARAKLLGVGRKVRLRRGLTLETLVLYKKNSTAMHKKWFTLRRMRNSINRDYIITHQKVLNRAELASLKRVCLRHFTLDKDRRNALLIILVLECGLRASEVLGLTVGDFDPLEGTVLISSKKGSNARELPIRALLARQLKKYVLDSHKKDHWHQIDPKALIFDISYIRLYQIWKYYTPNKDKTFHSLRHTFAVQFYLKTKDIKAVQLALGHRRIDNTMVYVDFVYNQTILRKLMTT
jgi:integrase